MINEWRSVQGNLLPNEISNRDSTHLAITKNVSKIDDGLYEYEEMVIPKDVFEVVKNSFYTMEYAKMIEQNQAGLDYVAMMADIEIPESGD